MQNPSYLVQSRHNIYYFRFPIPSTLHPQHKQSDLKISLNRGIVFDGGNKDQSAKLMLLPNAARKVLETFLLFKFPDLPNRIQTLKLYSAIEPLKIKGFDDEKLSMLDTGNLFFEDIAIPEQLDAAAVKQTITDIQQGRIKYQTFLRRIMEAGCAHYEVFITGRRAIYFGRDGVQHIEEFPKAA